MKSRNKEFILLSSYPQSIVSFRGDLIIALQKYGITVHVVSPIASKNSSIYKELTRMGVVVHQISLNRKGVNPLLDLVYFLRLVALFVSVKPKYVMGYTVKPVIYGSMAAIVCRTPYNFSLITGLGASFVKRVGGVRAIIQRILEYLYRISLSGSNAIFFQNIDDYELFLKNGIIKSLHKSVIVNGSGVNLDYYYKYPVPDKISFLLISRLIDEKGVLEFASAAQRIRSIYPDIEFVLAGWHDDSSISKTKIESWVKDERLIFLGKLEDVRSVIKKCSVFVLPSSYREGVPRIILEAMSMGRAIITTDTPGCRETVIDGKTGYLIRPKSTDELVLAMLKFVKSKDLISKMGENSRRLAEDKFDVHKVNATMLRGMGIIK
jgi:glycosyltransferase involved in cell wall biosynthesis